MKKSALIIIGAISFLGLLVAFWYFANQLSQDIILQVDNAGIILGYLLACFTITLGIIAWLRRQDIRQWLRKSQFIGVGESFDVPVDKVTAIVIPVSRVEQPEWIIRWLKPTHVSFLYTEAPNSLQAATELIQQFSEQVNFFPNKNMIKDKEFVLQNPDDPLESKQRTRFFLQCFLEMNIPIPRDEIFVDTTGGKVPMSIGAFQAAEEMMISSIYIVGTENGLIKDPRKREHGRPVFISDHREK